VLEQVGHGGAFLGHAHTFRRFRRELWEPALLERRAWGAWEKAGARDIRDVALERVQSLLATATAPALPADAAAEIDQIVHQAERDLVGKAV